MRRIKSILILVLILLPLISCDNTEPADTGASTQETVDTIPESPAETEAPPVLTYSGTEIPRVVESDMQHLPTDPIDEAKEGKIVYSVNSEKAGTVVGATVQNVGGQSFIVRAEANVGFKFVCWSDGKTDPERGGDTEEGVYTAIFDYDVSDLPIIVINTDSRIRSKTRYVGGTISIFGCEEEYIIEDAPLEIRGRGNATWRFEKKSYKFKLQDKENLFGIANGKERIWVLLANHCDQSLLRNHVGLELGRVLDGIVWEPASIPVEVYLNGDFLGAYLLAEEIKISGDRINVTDTTPDAIDTGYMLEMTNYVDRDDVTITVVKRDYVIHNDLSADEKIKSAQKTFIKDYVNDCYEALKYGDREKADSLIDLKSLAAVYILQETARNHDALWDNFYMWKDAGGKLYFGPSWDFDIAMSNAWDESIETTDFFAANGMGSAKGLADWFPIALANEWFRQIVADEWNAEYDKIKELPAYIIEEAERHKASYERNFERWPIFGQRINVEPDSIMALDSYTAHYTYLSEWMEERIEWLNSAFNHEDYITEGEGLKRVRKG
ncbi:MAG: hypothetical protein E7627_01735 [Ruminococcaceae bacterium]|nr:hypothetical protein [Oscillospiraceae bacterium]